MLRTWIPDTIPNRMLGMAGAQGPEQEYLISQSGKDGSLLMLEEDPLAWPPERRNLLLCPLVWRTGSPWPGIWTWMAKTKR